MMTRFLLLSGSLILSSTAWGDVVSQYKEEMAKIVYADTEQRNYLCTEDECSPSLIQTQLEFKEFLIPTKRQKTDSTGFIVQPITLANNFFTDIFDIQKGHVKLRLKFFGRGLVQDSSSKGSEGVLDLIGCYYDGNSCTSVRYRWNGQTFLPVSTVRGIRSWENSHFSGSDFEHPALGTCFPSVNAFLKTYFPCSPMDQNGEKMNGCSRDSILNTVSVSPLESGPDVGSTYVFDEATTKHLPRYHFVKDQSAGYCLHSYLPATDSIAVLKRSSSGTQSQIVSILRPSSRSSGSRIVFTLDSALHYLVPTNCSDMVIDKKSKKKVFSEYPCR